jgi:hypothetical protein
MPAVRAKERCHEFGPARTMPDVPMSEAMMDNKFIKCAEDELGNARARSVPARLRNLCALGDARDLLAAAR